jgi:secreted PhoX family phosphatase
MTFDPSGRLWVAQGTSIGIRDGYTGAPISTISTGALTNVLGIQFDRAGNLWITNPSDDGTTTTVNGYIAPVATASALPSPSSSFTLANSVNFVQGAHRRPAASAMQR